MNNTQEDVSEKVLRLMVRVPQLSAKMMVAALSYLLRKLEDREPVGLKKMDRLLQQNNKISVSTITTSDVKNLDADMKVFERFARQYGVGYSVIRDSGSPGYTIFYRAKSKEQYEKCLSEFMKYQQLRDFKMPDFKDADKPLEGEIEYSTDLVVGTAKTSPGKPDIILDTAIVLKRKREPISDRLERAKQSAAAMNMQRQAERQMERQTYAKEMKPRDISR